MLGRTGVVEAKYQEYGTVVGKELGRVLDMAVESG
jgi:hypothetical protein